MKCQSRFIQRSLMIGVAILCFAGWLTERLFAQGAPDIVWLKGAHAGAVDSVAFSPNGEQIASGSWDYTIKIWDKATGNLVRTLPGHSAEVYAIAYSPDGSLLASAGVDHTVRIWSVATGEVLHLLLAHTREVNSLAFSSNGSLLASGGWDGKVCVWRMPDGMLLRVVEAHSEGVISLAFSPDGRYLASGGRSFTSGRWRGDVKLWRLADGALVNIFAAHAEYVAALAFVPNSSILASGGGDRSIRLWRVPNGNLLGTIESTSPTYGLAFSPDGTRLASCGMNSRVRLWQVSDGTLLRSFAGHVGGVNSVAFSPDGHTLVSGGEDMTVRHWRVSNGQLIYAISGHTGEVTSVAFSPNNQLLASGGTDKRIFIRQSSDGSLQRILAGHTKALQSLAFSPDGQYLASCASEYDLYEGEYVSEVILWRVSDGTYQVVMSDHLGVLITLAFSPDGELLAVAGSGYQEDVRSSGMVYFLRVPSGESAGALNPHADWVRAIAFSPDSRLFATGAWDQRIKLWDTAGRTLTKTIEANGLVESLQFSPLNGVLASAQVRYVDSHWISNISLWSVRGGNFIRTFPNRDGWISNIAFSPDGQMLWSGNGTGWPDFHSVINVWRVYDGAPVRTYQGEMGTAVNSVAFAPNGRLFAYGRADATVVVARNPYYQLTGDVDGNGCVDDGDLMRVLFAFGQTGVLPEDLNQDLFVDDSDLLIVLQHFEEGC